MKTLFHEQIEIPGKQGAQMEEYYGETATVFEALTDLRKKGIFKAKSALSINRRVPVNDLKQTPVIICLLGYLELLDRNFGSLKIIDEERMIKESLQFSEIIEPNLRFLASLYSTTDEIPRFIQFRFWAQSISTEIGLVRREGRIISMAEKGRKLIEDKGVKNAYFQALQFATRNMSWFEPQAFPESTEEISYESGFLLFLTALHLKRGNQGIRTHELVKKIGKSLMLLKLLKKDGLSRGDISRILTDYFFWLYGFFFGLFRPHFSGDLAIRMEKAIASDDGEWAMKKIQAHSFRPTVLFKEILDWKILDDPGIYTCF